MKTLNKIGITFYSLSTLILIVFGLIYISRISAMPYHEAALGQSWDTLSTELQLLLLILIRISGGGWLGTGICSVWLIYNSSKTRSKLPDIMLITVQLCVVLPALSGSLAISANTPAEPPWIFAALSLFLIASGFIITIFNKVNR